MPQYTIATPKKMRSTFVRYPPHPACVFCFVFFFCLFCCCLFLFFSGRLSRPPVFFHTFQLTRVARWVGLTLARSIARILAAWPGFSRRTRRPLTTCPSASHSGELLDDRARTTRHHLKIPNNTLLNVSRRFFCFVSFFFSNPLWSTCLALHSVYLTFAGSFRTGTSVAFRFSVRGRLLKIIKRGGFSCKHWTIKKITAITPKSYIIGVNYVHHAELTKWGCRWHLIINGTCSTLDLSPESEPGFFASTSIEFLGKSLNPRVYIVLSWILHLPRLSRLSFPSSVYESIAIYIPHVKISLLFSVSFPFFFSFLLRISHTGCN